MKDSLMTGIWRLTFSLPQSLWQSQVAKGARDAVNRLGFMSEEHHRIRDFVVLELPRQGKPLSPEYIARALDLPLERVQGILDELEVNMTFLFRNQQGAVTWAYPVTVDKTPHHVTYSTGEQGYAA
jgi:hypothetical protein